MRITTLASYAINIGLAYFLYNKHRTKMNQSFEDLTREVSESRTLMTSATALIRGIARRLAEAANDPKKIAALATELDQSQTDLAQAITENTPQEEGSDDDSIVPGGDNGLAAGAGPGAVNPGTTGAAGGATSTDRG